MSKTVISLCLALLVFVGTASGQAAADRGVAGLKQALDRLDVIASVLHTGAHPDDENSSLLAWLARGRGVRTAYLSTTRGEGGQNLIGDELFEALGVIRSEELLAARRTDRARQFFTPNFEFGYSKTADETLEKWGSEQLVGDFVRVIRTFRPEIIISRFTGTPSDGHGHHQAAGIATIEAFRSAADTVRFPESEYGPAWEPKKLFISGGNAGGRGGAAGDVVINVGEYGAAIGRSFHELAMEGRSLHRTQSMGSAEEPGPQMTALRLVESRVASGDDPLFGGTIARLTDLATLEPRLEPSLASLEEGIAAIREDVRLDTPAQVVPALLDLVSEFEAIRTAASNDQVRFLLDMKRSDFHEAAELAAGIRFEVRVDDESAVPGQPVGMSLVVTNDGPYLPTGIVFETLIPDGWAVEPVSESGGWGPGERYERRMRLVVADDAEWTEPYWLRAPREGDRFSWPPDGAAMLPFDPPLIEATASVDFEGGGIEVSSHARYRYVDEVLGQRQALLKVVPGLSVSLNPAVGIVPVGGDRRKEMNVTLVNEEPDGGEATVRLAVPQGWTVTPESRSAGFVREGETASLQFVVDIPDVIGTFTVGASAAMNGRVYEDGYQVVAYPHIETHHLYSPAEARVEVFDVRTAVDRIGYVEGAGDTVADALRQLDVPVTFLNAGDLARGDLSVYDTIVLGIRAYAVRDDLRAYNQRLLDYVSEGGTVVVQYNTYEILNGDFGPYPFTINRPHDRVTVEDAPATFLDPDHPALNTPNRITAADFDGWVQERGLYFLGDRDSRYVPVLAFNDPGEDPMDGSLVVAEIGSGRWVYTGLAFFRQLRTGVPGAFRLFANIVSLGN